MANRFVETGIRMWKCGKLVLSQATPTSKYQLWGVHRQKENHTVMKGLGEFDTIDEATEFVSRLPRSDSVGAV